jgi:hypothetical protein
MPRFDISARDLPRCASLNMALLVVSLRVHVRSALRADESTVSRMTHLGSKSPSQCAARASSTSLPDSVKTMLWAMNACQARGAFAASRTCGGGDCTTGEAAAKVSAGANDLGG